MLSGAEPFAAVSGVVDEAFVRSLVREYPLAAQGLVEIAEAFVSEGAVDEPDVVAEIAGRAGDQISRCRRRVDQLAIDLAEQPQRFQCNQQGQEPVLRDAGDRCERARRSSALRNVG